MDPQIVAADPTTTMDMLLKQWPVIGLLAAYLFNTFMTRLKSRGIDLVEMGKQLTSLTDDMVELKPKIEELHGFLPTLREMRIESKELHEWHSVRDEDGVKIWYSSKRIMEKIEDKLGDMKATLEKLVRRTNGR